MQSRRFHSESESSILTGLDLTWEIQTQSKHRGRWVGGGSYQQSRSAHVNLSHVKVLGHHAHRDSEGCFDLGAHLVAKLRAASGRAV